VKANDGPVLVYRPQGERYNPLDLPWRSWSSPSYRGSPERPALSAHFVECNGALCTDALSRRYNPFTARPLLHSWFSCGSRMAIAAGRRQTPWLAAASAWHEPRGMDVCLLWVLCVPKATASTRSTAWAT